jgi:UDP-glucose 4-epimerase
MSFDDPVADLHKNTVSTLNLIQYAISVGVQRFVYASSMSVYGNNFLCASLFTLKSSSTVSRAYV